MSRHNLDLELGTVTAVESLTVYHVQLADRREVRCTLRSGLKRLFGLKLPEPGTKVSIHIKAKTPDAGKIHEIHHVE